MTRCTECEKVYDSDEQMEVDENGDMVCDACYESRCCKYWHEDGEILTEVCKLVAKRCFCCGQLCECDYEPELNKKRGI